MALVSIITPSFNSEEYISNTINSVISQTFEDWQLIIVDDASTDNSTAIISKFCQEDSRIKLIQRAENGGAAAARNIGIQAAKGRFIAFLDSDDLWYPEKLEEQLSFMTKQDIDFSFTGYEKINEQGIPFQRMRVPVKLSYQELLKTCYIGCLTVIYDTRSLGKVYMPNNTKREDYATWLTILKKTPYAYAVPKTLAKYRVYSTQSSTKKANMAKENWYLYRNIENLSFFKSLYYFAHYAINGLLRTKLPKVSEVSDSIRGFK